MKNLVEAIVKPLVEHPDDVRVEAVESEGIVSIRLFVNQADIGKVIGRQGKVVSAIRKIVQAQANSENKRVHFQIVE